MDPIIEPPKPVEDKKEEAPAEIQTSIDIDAEKKVLTVQINLIKGPVNAYGTLQYAMELACRYFTTLEIMKRKQQAEDSASRIIVPTVRR